MMNLIDRLQEESRITIAKHRARSIEIRKIVNEIWEIEEFLNSAYGTDYVFSYVNYHNPEDGFDEDFKFYGDGVDGQLEIHTDKPELILKKFKKLIEYHNVPMAEDCN